MFANTALQATADWIRDEHATQGQHFPWLISDLRLLWSDLNVYTGLLLDIQDSVLKI